VVATTKIEGVKDRRYYKVHYMDEFCTRRSKIGHLQVLGEYKAYYN